MQKALHTFEAKHAIAFFTGSTPEHLLQILRTQNWKEIT